MISAVVKELAAAVRGCSLASPPRPGCQPVTAEAQVLRHLPVVGTARRSSRRRRAAAHRSICPTRPRRRPAPSRASQHPADAEGLAALMEPPPPASASGAPVRACAPAPCCSSRPTWPSPRTPWCGTWTRPAGRVQPVHGADPHHRRQAGIPAAPGPGPPVERRGPAHHQREVRQEPQRPDLRGRRPLARRPSRPICARSSR